MMNYKTLGRYVLNIRNELFEAIIPEVSEMVNYAIDENLEIKERWYTVNGKKIPEVNVLWFVKDITSELASTLDTRDKILLLKDYYLAVKVLSSYGKHEDSNIRLIKNDYDEAVNNILAAQPDYFASRMASLKLAEKIIKSKLESECIEFEGCQRFTDFPEKLDCANIEGLEEIISKIEDTSKEGDSDTPVTCEEAVSFLENSLRLYLKLFHPSKEPKITTRG
ncbi:hypothetical protein ACFL6W_00405 [Thermodesulfobacteriota bacterium]